jgi:hypothetical protein
LSVIRKKEEKDNAEAQRTLRFAEKRKRDGNTPTGSGQAPFTEGRT